MLVSLKDNLLIYLQQNEKFLAENYPGLGLKRLLEEVKLCIGREYCLHDDSAIFSHSKKYNEFIKGLSEGIPLEYLSGKKYFWNSYFHVNQHTLIPRYETEVLVDLALKKSKPMAKQKKLNIADVGTGCGNIILSLAQELEGEHSFFGLDIDKKTLELAKKNHYFLSYTLNQKKKIKFILSDRLENTEDQFDLIISNPPYFKKLEDDHKIHDQVKKFEPHKALFIEDNKFENWYDDFFSQCANSLNRSGYLFIESDAEYIDLLEKLGNKYKLEHCEKYKDLAGIERFISFKRG